MNDGLDAALILPEAGEKPSVQYRRSPYTVREYCALPYAQRRAVDAACDEAAGLTYSRHTDERSPQPYTIGRATRPATEGLLLKTEQKAAPGVSVQLDEKLIASTLPAILSTTSPMTTTLLHPAPSPALHTLNTPEAIHHDAAHPDSLLTSAVPMPTACEEQAHGDYALTPDALTHALGEAARPAPAPEVLQQTGPLPAQPLAALTQAITQAAAPAVPTAPLAHDGTVYETTDYDLFHLLPENRNIDPNQVRKLVAAIQKRNLLHLTPILVTPELGIIDGQHRREAARELGLPLYYKVGRQLSEADITTLNTASKNWTGSDWLKYWAVKRKPAYVALADFMQRHPRLSFSNAKIMLTGTGGGGASAEAFRAGQWDGADDEDMGLAEQVAELVERVAAEVPSFKAPFHTGFVTALYHCVAHVEGFDAKEMLRTILVQPRSLVTCAGHKQWLQMLSDLYNYRKNEGNRLRFV